jgi:hypothetical protein
MFPSAPLRPDSVEKLNRTSIPAPQHKTFELEGEILERALTSCLQRRNEALKDLCAAVRRFRDASVKRQRRVQGRLSARDAGDGKTVGSSGGFDSMLSPMCGRAIVVS